MEEPKVNGSALAKTEPTDIFKVLVAGALNKLTDKQKTEYYHELCVSLGLNSATRPFEFLTLQGKTVLYARKDATDQLRKLHNVSLEIVSREVHNGSYVVTVRATMPSGIRTRTDESIGAVSIENAKGELLKGDAYANALMKAETKAKRRATLSICGLGFIDESEVHSIPGVVVPKSEPPPAYDLSESYYEEVMGLLNDGELDAAKELANLHRGLFNKRQTAAIRAAVDSLKARE